MIGAIFFYYYAIKTLINEIYCYCKNLKDDYFDINLIESFSKVFDELSNFLDKIE